MTINNRTTGSDKGFSLVELLVVVTIISTLATVTLSATFQARKREQINALTIELAGWIEEVRRSSMRGNQCGIRITTGSISGSDIVAQATPGIAIPDTCSTKATPLFRIPEQSREEIFQITTGNPDFLFTPRGTKIPANDVTIVVKFSNASQARCIKLNGLLGNLEMGNAPGGICNTALRF